jgi:hypothetical protein
MKTLRIMGDTYRIYTTTLKRITKLAGGPCRGLWTSEPKMIHIVKTTNKFLFQRILWHEVIHAIAFKLHIDLNEEKTDALAKELCAVLKDNEKEWDQLWSSM